MPAAFDCAAIARINRNEKRNNENRNMTHHPCAVSRGTKRNPSSARDLERNREAGGEGKRRSDETREPAVSSIRKYVAIRRVACPGRPVTRGRIRKSTA